MPTPGLNSIFWSPQLSVTMAEDLFQCQSLYAVLGLDDSATTDVIKARHKQLALKWHPDKWMTSSEEERHNAEEQFKMVSAAFMV